MSGNIRVKDFYADQTIFLTGFTGFLGKVLVEKLLWSCHDLKRIYVLIRTKNNQNVQQRLTETFSSLAFNRLKANYPERLEKVVGLAGDVTEEGLGLSQEDTIRIIEETSIIFHGAASVRFDDPIKVAAEINTRGGMRVLELAKQMPNLKSLVVTSTAYVNCDRSYAKEKIYPAKINWRDFLKVVDNTDETTLSILTQKFIGVMPNTYVFTKSITEHVFDEGSAYVPTIICRPSVVAPAITEPEPGWVDNIFGPVGILLGGECGVMRVHLMDPDCPLDYVFCDQATNATIALAPKAPSPLECRETTVVHMSSGRGAAYTGGDLLRGSLVAAADEDCKLGMLVIWVYLINNEIWFTINVFFRHLMSSYIIDGLIYLAGKKPLLVKLRRKMYQASRALIHFTHNDFQFDTTNFFSLYNSIQPNEKEEFCFLWKEEFDVEFCINAIRNARRVLTGNVMKIIYSDVGRSRKYILGLYYMDLSAVLVTYAGASYLLYKVLPIVFEALQHFFLDSFL